MNNFVAEYKKPAISAIVFFATLVGVSYAYASLSFLMPVNSAVSGSGVSAAEWNKIVSNFTTIDTKLTAVVPTGAVMAFNLASCPTGWSAADGNGGRPDLRGEFVRGLDSGRGVDSWRTLKSAQNATRVFQYNSTDLGYQGGLWDHDQFISSDYDGGVESISGGGYSAATSGSSINSWAVYGVRVRPRNVALLYCVKD